MIRHYSNGLIKDARGYNGGHIDDKRGKYGEVSMETVHSSTIISKISPWEFEINIIFFENGYMVFFSQPDNLPNEWHPNEHLEREQVSCDDRLNIPTCEVFWQIEPWIFIMWKYGWQVALRQNSDL